MIVEDCINITRSFCDLTDEWDSMTETYVTTVVGIRGNTTLVSCWDRVFPALDSELISVVSSSLSSSRSSSFALP